MNRIALRLGRRLRKRLLSALKPLTRWPTTHRRNGTPLRVLWRCAFRRKFDRKVDFVVAGAMRSGTSALFQYIRQHPEVCTPALKEVHYFDEDRFFRSAPDYSKYHAWFSPKRSHKVIGEATPGYMYRQKTPQRLFDYDPRLKLIMILRDPVERAYSHWNKERREGISRGAFSEVIERHKRAVLRKEMDANAAGIEKIERGYYAQQIERIWSFFPREQTLILRNEDLREHPDETMERVFDFIGVSPKRLKPTKRPASAEYPAPMSDEDRAYLNDLYRPHVKALEELLGWDCSDWLR